MIYFAAFGFHLRNYFLHMHAYFTSAWSVLFIGEQSILYRWSNIMHENFYSAENVDARFRKSS